MEHAVDPVYFKQIGVDIDNLLISQPSTGEEALEGFDTHQRRQEPPSWAWGHVAVERIPAEGRDVEKLEPPG